jgi:multidrug transporter EmrE-like cation transporter
MRGPKRIAEGHVNIPALIALVIPYAAISAFGLALIKQAPALIDPRALTGAAFYAGGFAIWILILRLCPLSVAFPVAAGSLVVATQAVARFYLGETVSSMQTLGVAAIVIGIALAFVRA